MRFRSTAGVPSEDETIRKEPPVVDIEMENGSDGYRPVRDVVERDSVESAFMKNRSRREWEVESSRECGIVQTFGAEDAVSWF